MLYHLYLQLVSIVDQIDVKYAAQFNKGPS